MASKEAPFAQSSNLDRMGALAKWIAAKAEEMTQMDRKIERRLDHLQRSEDNLRAVFEAIREQVASAHSVSDELQKQTAAADEREQHREQKTDELLISALEKASKLVEAVDAKTRELEQTAEAILQSSVDRLNEIAEQTREAHAAAAAVPPTTLRETQQSRFDSDTGMLHSDFEQRSAIVLESIRRSAVEQIERLSSQAAVAVDPILARVDSQRQRAEAQLNAAVTAAEEALRRRADDLVRTGDLAVDAIEQRLARRLENIRPRTIETFDAAERAMNQRVNAMVEGARLTVAATETELTGRVAQLAPRLTQDLQAVQDNLVEQLARLEEHAFAMTGWLDQRMGERVDALVARTRLALSQTPTAAPAPLSPEAVAMVCYADEYSAPASPNSVDVQIFVDRRNDRSHRSTAASIFK